MRQLFPHTRTALVFDAIFPKVRAHVAKLVLESFYIRLLSTSSKLYGCLIRKVAVDNRELFPFSPCTLGVCLLNERTSAYHARLWQKR